MRVVIAIVVVAIGASCTSATGLDVTADYQASFALDALGFSIVDQQGLTLLHETQKKHDTGALDPEHESVVVELPDADAGDTAIVTVEGFANGTLVASGKSGATELVKSSIVPVTVVLDSVTGEGEGEGAEGEGEGAEGEGEGGEGEGEGGEGEGEGGEGEGGEGEGEGGEGEGEGGAVDVVFDYTPSNLVLPIVAGSDANLACGGTIAIDTGARTISGWCGATPPAVVDVSSGNQGKAAVRISVGNFTLAAGTNIAVTGSSALIVVVNGDADIGGVIDASGHATTSGPGAAAGLDCTAAQQGRDGGPQGPAGSGGGGGGFGGGGGNGGDFTPPSPNPALQGGTGGGASGGSSLAPLRGGCAGAAGGTSANAARPAGGGAGGALQVTATGTIHVEASGSIVAGGGGGAAAEPTVGGGGGGAGGAVLLEADVVTVDGVLAANGGGGGGGGGDPTAMQNNVPAQAGQDATGAAVATGGAGGAPSTDNPRGNGGNGGSSASVDAFSGQTTNVQGAGGGGGGSAGRIRINAHASCTKPGTISPNATFGSSTCT